MLDSGSRARSERSLSHTGMPLRSKSPKTAKAPDNYRGRALSLDAPIAEESETTFGDVATGQTMPVVSLDLSALSKTDQQIVEAKAAGYTLAEIGKAHGISAERVRQREARALRQVRARSRFQMRQRFNQTRRSGSLFRERSAMNASGTGLHPSTPFASHSPPKN